jgi:cation diffusion facilitator family transporter
MFNFLIRKWVKNPEDTASPAVRTAYGKLSGAVGIALNFLLFAGKVVVGLLSGSVSVAADAINNLSDASSSVISLLGFKLAEKPADEEHPYGHGRYEYLAGLTVAFLIMVIGVELARASFEKILHPSPAEFSWLTIAVLAASMLVKAWMMVFNRRVGKRIDSETLLAAACDSRNDVITSFAVAAAALVSHFAAFDLDGWMGFAVAVFILYSSFGLVRDTLDPLLGRAPDAEFVAHIHKKILSYPGVLGTHDLMVHDYGPGRLFASAHVEMAAEEEVCKSHDVIDNIERDFLEHEGLHIVLHFDPILTADSKVQDLRAWLSEEVKILDPVLSVHDLRLVTGPTHSNLIFDVAAPHSFPLSDAELRAAIGALVKKSYPTYLCVITVDRNYAALAHPAPDAREDA